MPTNLNRAEAEISRCPATNTRRKVTAYRQIHDAFARLFEIVFLVEYLDVNGDVITTSPYVPYVRKFDVNDTHSVDANGNVVTEGGVMTEYEYYVAAINAGYGFFQLQQEAIPVLDSNQRFD